MGVEQRNRPSVSELRERERERDGVSALAERWVGTGLTERRRRRTARDE